MSLIVDVVLEEQPSTWAERPLLVPGTLLRELESISLWFFCIYTSCKGQDRIFSLSSAIESDLEGYGELVSQWELRYVLRT
jgi:hypothetical protein